jgi:DNA modification methylase
MRTMAPEQIPFTFGHIRTEKTERSSTFLDNLSLPIHRWFRYSAGFSALWVRDLIREEKAKDRTKVLDPFCGSGTVLLEGESLGVEAIGVEAHPFIARVARAKLHWREDPRVFRDYALSVLQRAKRAHGDSDGYAPLIHKCFPRGTLARLDTLRRAWERAADGSPNSELTWLALVSILRETSPAGTAQWQYVLPKKAKSKVLDPYAAFESKVYLMSSDMAERQTRGCMTAGVLYQEDARKCPSLRNGWADLVITSPPYTNNYDYADATRLEMTFCGEIGGWGDLQETVRKYLVRSCTQHVAGLNGKVPDILNDPLVDPIRRELGERCRQLEGEREKHAGRKPYHAMIAAYFQDMANVWVALRRITREGSLVCFVVGDSGPYGVYIPVHRWLGQLALAAGFKTYAFEKIRDRNVKWKNRKHRLPLQEGRLWVEG